ncbi:MAG: hypothetical protein J7M38_10795, partial [Armatimonadetes bacterium]|nr:hypothetical protein [Armatimonadota bacterium]
MTPGNHSTHVCRYIIAALLLTGGVDVVSAQEAPVWSHLTPHLAAEVMTHLGVHVPGLPPPALLVPLGNGVDGVLKGVNLADEARLMDALSRARLHQTVLRVAVGRAPGSRMALVKLQA